jgi:hypothetical protein
MLLPALTRPILARLGGEGAATINPKIQSKKRKPSGRPLYWRHSLILSVARISVFLENKIGQPELSHSSLPGVGQEQGRIRAVQLTPSY